VPTYHGGDEGPVTRTTVAVGATVTASSYTNPAVGTYYASPISSNGATVVFGYASQVTGQLNGRDAVSGTGVSYCTGVFTYVVTSANTILSATSSTRLSAPAGPAIQTVSTYSPIAVTAVFTPKSPASPAPSDPGPLPLVVSNFELVGCVALSSNYDSFELVENSTMMSIPRCIRNCESHAYAGLFDT
jgi:hypothetical protein